LDEKAAVPLRMESRSGRGAEIVEEQQIAGRHHFSVMVAAPSLDGVRGDR
jgi:hypothetical protein